MNDYFNDLKARVDTAMPSGGIFFGSSGAQCPPGWTAFQATDGRLIAARLQVGGVAQSFFTERAGSNLPYIQLLACRKNCLVRNALRCSRGEQLNPSS